jgi:hypothetical protein
MRGLDPRIHPLRKTFLRRSMDCRVKPAMTAKSFDGVPDAVQREAVHR